MSYFDLKYWAHTNKLSVRQFIQYCENYVPMDATITCCGKEDMYFHLTEDKKHFSIDTDSLEDGYLDSYFEKNGYDNPDPDIKPKEVKGIEVIEYLKAPRGGLNGLG